MLIQEAIKILDEVIPEPNSKLVDFEHLQIAQAWSVIRALIQKELPKKPYREKMSTYSFCPHCGQRLDWSE